MAVDHNPVDLAYAAGFFDGEGAISILRVGSHRGGRDTYKVLAIAVNNNRPVLDGLQTQFGGRLYKSGHKTQPAHWRPSFQWHLYGDECERFIRDVRPYLRIKGALADSALEFFALQHQRGKKRDTPPDVWERMKQVHSAHRGLIEKGHAPRGRATTVAVSEATAVPEIEESAQLELSEGGDQPDFLKGGKAS